MSRAHRLSAGEPLGTVGCEVTGGGGARTRHSGGAGGGATTAPVFRPGAAVSAEGLARVWRVAGAAAAATAAVAIGVVTATALTGAAVAAGGCAAGCGAPSAQYYGRCR